MAKDPTQGPVSTYDAESNPTKTNAEEIVAEETAVDESTVEEAVEETAAEEDAVEEESEEELSGEEGSADGEGEGEAADDKEAPEEDGVAPKEDLWDRLTEVGAESDPEKGEVRHVEFTCDRCGETKQGMLLPEGTVGFYALDDELGWGAKYANEGEEILCDACMQSDERYLADYPDEEAPIDEEDVDETPEEVADETTEEESFEAHEHEVDAPLTYADAEKQLEETSYANLREMAVADGLKPERSRAKIAVQLLNHWFAEPPSLAGFDEPQMSVRIRRIKEASSQ